MNNNDTFEKIILGRLLSCSDAHITNIYYVNRPNSSGHFIIFNIATIVFDLIDSVNLA